MSYLNATCSLIGIILTMTSEADVTAVRREMSREGPGNQPGGIPSSLVGHVVFREGPGIKPGGIPGTCVNLDLCINLMFYSLALLQHVFP